MVFFLITFLISLGAIALTWTPLASTKIGIADIFQRIYKTAGDRIIAQGLSLFAFAFFLHAILQSQVFQSLFASKRKWLEKKKYFTIGLITIAAALLSSNLSWFDEFVHFYPLVIPLLMAMGFDIFSSILCLYGGSIVGLMGLVSPERMKDYFGQSFGSVEKGINYSGTTGMSFRLVAFVLFTTIIILFNIWYCSRNRKKPKVKSNNLVKDETPPPFNRTRKIILAVAGFFLLVSVFAQIPLFENKLPGKVPKQISSEFDKEEDKYEEVGKVGEKEFAQVKKDKESYWEKFGKWEARSIDCWLIIGAIIICLLAKQSVMGTFISSAQSAIPLLLIYIFAAVPAAILKDSGVSTSLAKNILPDRVMTQAKYWVLLPVFGLSMLITFLISSSSMIVALIAALAPALASLSDSVLIYAAIFAWVGGILGMAFSPNNGILRASLEKSETSYKKFIKKTWVLGLILLAAAFGLVLFWTITNIK